MREGSSCRLRTSRLASVVEKHRVAVAGRMLPKHRPAWIILPSSGYLTVRQASIHLEAEQRKVMWYRNGDKKARCADLSCKQICSFQRTSSADHENISQQCARFPRVCAMRLMSPKRLHTLKETYDDS